MWPLKGSQPFSEPYELFDVTQGSLVRSSRLLVSFAEYGLFYRALLQKRPVILRSLAHIWALRRHTGLVYECVVLYIYECVVLYIYECVVLRTHAYECVMSRVIVRGVTRHTGLVTWHTHRVCYWRHVTGSHTSVSCCEPYYEGPHVM